MLEQLGDDLQQFWRIDDSELEILQETYGQNYAVPYSDQFAGFLKLGKLNMLCQKKSLAVEGGLRLHKLEGVTEATPSWQLEVIGS